MWAGMKAVLILASVLSLTSLASVASADSDESFDGTQLAPRSDTYVAIDAGVGGQRALGASIGASVGRRLNDTPLFARLAVVVGVEGSDGKFQQVRQAFLGRRHRGLSRVRH